MKFYGVAPLLIDSTMHHRPCNILSVSGQFSLGQAHSWVSLCLPDVPERPPAEDMATLYFKSTFIHTQLECSYR